MKRRSNLKQFHHIFNRDTLSKLSIGLFFITVSIILMRNLLTSGYILTLDMIFTPNNYPEVPFSIFTITKYALYFLTILIPSWLLQKIILISTLSISGINFFKLSRILVKSNRPIALLSSLLYMVNPFVYQRFVAGQWLFLIGYSITPLFIYLCIDYFQKIDSKSSLWKILGLWIIASLFSQHHFLIFGLIFGTFTIVYTAHEMYIFRSIQHLSKKSVQNLFIITFGSLLLLIYSQRLEFDSSQLSYFASYPGPYDFVILNLLSLHGFWGEKILINNIFANNTFSTVAYLIIFSFSILGTIIIATLNYFQKKLLDKKVLLSIVIITVLGLTLSLGSYGIIGVIYRFGVDEFPILRGMREPQKFLSIFIIGLSLGFGFTINYLNTKILTFSDKRISLLVRSSLFSFVALSLLISILPIFNNFDNQLKTSNFPKEYFEVKSILDSQNNLSTLALPSTNYMDTSWNNNRIANPAKQFFGSDIITYQESYIYSDRQCDIESDITYENSEGELKYKVCFKYSDDAEIVLDNLRLIGVDQILILNYKDLSQNLANILSADGVVFEYQSNEVALVRISKN